jgi:hypothetical protein
MRIYVYAGFEAICDALFGMCQNQLQVPLLPIWQVTYPPAIITNELGLQPDEHPPARALSDRASY